MNARQLADRIANVEFKRAFAEDNLRYIATEPEGPDRDRARAFNIKVIEDTERELADLRRSELVEELKEANP